ncbi:hypothetical protein SLA2020_362030 [Shorea laevis]
MSVPFSDFHGFYSVLLISKSHLFSSLLNMEGIMIVRRKACERVLEEDDGDVETKVYRFKILLPNGTSVELTFRDPQREIAFGEFIERVKDEYNVAKRQSESMRKKRTINWNGERLYLEDANDRKMSTRIDFGYFKPHKRHILRLHDGTGEIVNTFENMWDLTPDTDWLLELPEEYTFETALADLIDNSLQAVWLNGENDRRLISVDILMDRISIFDTGIGMDSTEENSIAKWGKMGASLHRLSKIKGIGDKPPYLMPFFGMFGYGGPIASMHLGRHAVVSSKTKESNKVYTLHLEREALLGSTGSELTWRTKGGMRNPYEEESRKSPHGSFTKVEILKPKVKELDVFKLQCRLKDIYFPYIQCDELSEGKTTTPVEFQVDNTDLAEIDGGEVAITNLLSCNGPAFTIKLHFSFRSPGPKTIQVANARLKCIYFPIVQGKENIENILARLKDEGCETGENFESFSRVSIRRLGRLLPDARWPLLPFMDLRQKKGEKSQLLKRCCLRAKCFIETDGGFNPTTSKTDLARHSPLTIALKNIGRRTQEKDVSVEIYRNGKLLTPLQLEKEYQDWLLQMHDHYDEETGAGGDQPVLVAGLRNKKALGISQDVVRVHKILKRRGVSWTQGQKIKILKGACAGVYKNNIYATLEYFLIEGFEGDAGGEARIICRPINVADGNGCLLSVNDENVSLDIQSSLSVPIGVIDSGKCLVVDDTSWECQLEKERQKTPSAINLLSAKHCKELGIDGALPIDDATVYAGLTPPNEIVAVVRPASFTTSSASKYLDQKDIMKHNLSMSMNISFKDYKKNSEDTHLQSKCVRPSSRKGFDGLYIFLLGSKSPNLFEKAGVYKFSFSLIDSNCKSYEKRLVVVGSPKVGKWELLGDELSPYRISVGLSSQPFSIACYDIFHNRIPFCSVPDLMIKICTMDGLLIDVPKMKAELSLDKMILKIKDVMTISDQLDLIRPNYDASLLICPKTESASVSIPCQVMPGNLCRITAHPPKLGYKLLPGSTIKQLKLEVFDKYGNHVIQGLEVQIKVDGFCIQGQVDSKHKVNDQGCIDLGGLLTVTAGFGKTVSLSVLSENEVVFQQDFETEERQLRVASRVPDHCTAGSKLENLVFEVVNSKGVTDRTIHDDEQFGQYHTLTLKSDYFKAEDTIRYAFVQGCCVVPSIAIPQIEGPFHFIACHSRYTELHLSIQVLVNRAPKGESDEIESPCSNGKMLLLQHTASLKKGLWDELEEYGERIGKYEDMRKILDSRKESIEQGMSLLPASPQLDLLKSLDRLFTEEEMIKRIKKRAHSAAAVICSVSQEFPIENSQIHCMGDVIGVVALLGKVGTNALSRILAEFLGEEQMLAVVCKSLAATDNLEKHAQNGEVDLEYGLHARAAALGKSINGRFLVLCLEGVRPYSGQFKDAGPQRKLALPDPLLPTGNTPAGFMGYAVNMIDPDLETSAAGHPLRETLFYRLFGELQVYDTREHIKEALAYIKHSAVSLDGGILRENGAISLGYCNPEICFPVDMQLSPENKMVLKHLQQVYHHIEDVDRNHEKVLKKFNKTKKKLQELMDLDEPQLKNYYLEYHSNLKNS